MNGHAAPDRCAVATATDDGGTGFQFTGDLGAFALNDDGSQAFSGLSAGDYNVVESPPVGWSFDTVICSGGDSTPIGSGVTVHLGAGETIACTFYNTVSAPPSGGSTDAGGLGKDTYTPEETVYVAGSDFLPNAQVDVYVVEDHTWTDGLAIPVDLSGDGMNTLSTDGAGAIAPTPVWSAPLVAGNYDLVFDANQNGQYDAATDVVDDPNHPGLVVEPIKVHIDPDQDATLVYTDPHGFPTVIQIPAGAVAQAVDLCFSPLLSPTQPFPPDFANHAFQFGLCGQQPAPVPVGGVTFPPLVSAEQGAVAPLYPYLPLILRDKAGGHSATDSLGALRPPSGKALAAPSLETLALDVEGAEPNSIILEEPVTVSIHYSDLDVSGIADETKLRLYYWTGSAWDDVLNACPGPATYIRDPVGNVIQVPVCHLSEFALGG
jgi:hypothetical protein